MTWPVSHTDECLEVFLQACPQWDMPLLDGHTIIEVGCAEANWMSMAHDALPTARLVGIDVRPCERPGVVMRGDVRRVVWPPHSADWVVFISSLEHIGLGYYGDPVYPHGDFVALAHAHRWLKPGGSVYFDVPWTPTGRTVSAKQRTYDAAALDQLAQGWIPRRRAGFRASTESRSTDYVACWWSTPGRPSVMNARA